MAQKFTRKEALSLLGSVGFLALIPVSAWLMRPGPLAAASPAELASLALNARQDEIVSQMSKRYEGMSLHFEDSDPSEDPNLRWQEIESSILRENSDETQAGKIIQAAKIKLHQDWPILAERSYLKRHPVWLVIGSSPHDTGFIGWPCTPSAEAIREEKIKKYYTKARVAIIDADAPYQLLN